MTAPPAWTSPDDLHRQEENCSYTAVSFMIWLRWLRRIRWTANVSPVLFGALATWKIVQHDAPTSAAVFAFLATTIPLLYRAMKVDESIAQYTHAAGELTNLRDRFRISANQLAKTPGSVDPAYTEGLLIRLEKVRDLSLVPPEFCFWLARSKHKQGEFVHDYDAQT